ncbi:hypothetical protein ACHAQJ_001636 [Trichoderma viride]
MVSPLITFTGVQPQLSSQAALFSDEHVNLLNEPRDNNQDADFDDCNGDETTAPSDTQSNIGNIETVTLPWTTSGLVFAYIMIWLTYFVEGILSATTGILTPYVTVIGGVTNLTLAKVLDIFGRAQGYLFCIVLATGGLIMMSICTSIQAYAAPQVFQTIGNNGILYSLTVFVADTSSMRNRGLAQAIVSSPNLITLWLAGPISSRFLNGPS